MALRLPRVLNMHLQREIIIVDATGVKMPATISGDVRHWSEDGFSRRECRITLRYERGEVHGVGTDFFNAFCRIREQLAGSGIYPVCYGASRNVYPNGMSRSMGAGLKAYRLQMGRQAEQEDLVHIFDSGPDIELATVEAQKAFADGWFDQYRK